MEAPVNPRINLLKELHELQPDLCSIEPNSVEPVYVLRHPVESWYIAAEYSHMPVIAMRIQTAIQWAVTQKDNWEMMLQFSRGTEEDQPCWVCTVYTDFQHPEVNATDSVQADPDLACLEAYVLALKEKGV